MTVGLAAACGVLTLAVLWLWANQRVLARLHVSRARDTETLSAEIGRQASTIGARIDRALIDQAAVDATTTAAHDRVLGRLKALEETRPRVEMTLEQLADMRAHWPELVCQFCGLAHPGTCPRVKEQTIETFTDPHGRIVRTVANTEFWPNDQWTPPEGAISVQDVFGVPVTAEIQESPV